MPPPIALALWAVLLVLLLIFDPAKDSRVSVALWVPLLWMLIVASRLPAQWLGGATVAQVQNSRGRKSARPHRLPNTHPAIHRHPVHAVVQVG